MATYFEERINILKRRIDNIKSNPSKFHLRTNTYVYEAELKGIYRILDAWKSGKPFALGHGFDALLVSMGFMSHGYISYADRVSWNGQTYLDACVQAGYSDHSCDRTLTALGMLLKKEIPPPSFVASFRFACDPARMSQQAAAKEVGAPFYSIDTGYGIHYDSLRYTAEQLEEMIIFIEKNFPGMKYNEERLLDILDRHGTGGEGGLDTSKAAGSSGRDRTEIAQQVYELRKKIPCPMSPQDAFRLGAGSRASLREMQKRAERGQGGVPNERLRVAWMATGPYGRPMFDLLTEKGVSIPWFHYGGAPSLFGVLKYDERFDSSQYEKKLTTLERVAKIAHFSMWAQQGDYWIDPLIKVCKELKIDAVVNFLQPGCVVTKGLRKIISDRVKEEVGIPVLDLEGRQQFNTPSGHEEMRRSVSEFVDFCIENKS